MATVSALFLFLFSNVASAVVAEEVLTVTINPGQPFEGLNFTIDVEADNGIAFDLPALEFPGFPENPTPEDVEAVIAFQAALIDSVENDGKQWVSYDIYKEVGDVDISVYGKKFLLAGDSDVIVSDDELQIRVPVLDMDEPLLAGNYSLVVIRSHYVDGQPTFGEARLDFSISPLFFDFMITPIIDPSIFVLPGDFWNDFNDDADPELIAPTSLSLVPEIAYPNMDVVVTVLDQNGMPIDLPELWYVDVWPIALPWSQENVVLSTDVGINGVDLADGDGTFIFKAPAVGEYNVGLYDATEIPGNVVSTQQLTVKVTPNVPIPAFELNPDLFDAIDLAGLLDDFQLPDGLLDPDGENGEVEVEGDGNGGGVVDDDDVAIGDGDGLRCTDVEEDYWAFEIINNLLDDNLYPVVMDGLEVNCRPLTAVKRKEFTAWLLAAYNPEAVANIDEVDVSENPFSDLSEDDPYAPYVIKAKELGIIDGYGDGTFKPDAQINRVEVLKILLHASGLFDADVEGRIDILVELNPEAAPKAKFSDTASEEAWYYYYLYYAVANDIIVGYDDGTAKPEQGVIFSEAAKILYLTEMMQHQQVDDFSGNL